MDDCSNLSGVEPQDVIQGGGRFTDIIVFVFLLVFSTPPSLEDKPDLESTPLRQTQHIPRLIEYLSRIELEGRIVQHKPLGGEVHVVIERRRAVGSPHAAIAQQPSGFLVIISDLDISRRSDQFGIYSVGMEQGVSGLGVYLGMRGHGLIEEVSQALVSKTLKDGSVGI